jgi:hypothetical protein
MKTLLLVCLVAATAAWAEVPLPGYDDTPMQPWSKWRVHDKHRPHPIVVTPGTCGTQETPGKAPSDAVMLFDGKDLSQWENEKHGPAGWKVENGYMEVAPQSGSIVSKPEFGDCQVHVEWCAPNPPTGADQGRGNSGVFLMGLYEVQVLDNYENPTYADGGAGAIYGQFPPMVNANRKPGEWQTYDIIFEAPVFDAAKKVTRPAYVTVIFNGVVVQNHQEIMGDGTWRKVATYSYHGPSGPLKLQAHNNPVRYRNIWVRPIKLAQ